MPETQDNFSQAEFQRCVRSNPDWPRLYAEGDSWFAFPLSAGNVLRQLMRRRRWCLLSRAKSGSTFEEMLGLKQRKALVRDLSRWEFDALLLSAGGNDIAGDGLVSLLRDWRPGMVARDAIDRRAWEAKLDLLDAFLAQFCGVAERLQPGIPVLCHTYDVPHPDGRGVLNRLRVLGRGPWLQPSMDFRGIPRHKQRAVIRLLLAEYAARLRRKPPANLVVLRTQGLIPNVKDWNDELHPRKVGFQRVAAAYHARLRELPGF